MSRARLVETLVLTTAVASVLAVATWGSRETALAQQPTFSITSTVPTELNPTGGGPAQASLQQAAEFAWQEFFALNWPAGPNPTQRDTPLTTCAFGDQSDKCTGPLVWETFRGKVEIFPGNFAPPNGYNPNDPSFGYDSPPQYNYGVTVDPCPGTSAVAPGATAWVNLDETDQITLDSMYAGIVTAKPAGNSAPQLIRFLAKANRAEYVYIARNNMSGNEWWAGNAPTGATAAYVKKNMKDPPNGTDYVLLPPNGDATLPGNTIELKAGWRVLNPDEESSGKFHKTTVRFYENSGTAQSPKYCYQQATFGLVALHIIQKTPMAPYFIYATFEQADNILDANGNPVEDADGRVVVPCTPPCATTTPSVTLNDTATVVASHIPPNVVLVPDSAPYCTTSTSEPPKNKLYYLNANDKAALPNKGFICVNKRDNDIPPAIVDTNKNAHDLIRSYSAQNGVQNSVWQYYKLVNVQYTPVDKNHTGLYGTQSGEDNFSNDHNPSTYYLANIVVETNRALQLFSGGLVSQGSTGSNSDYDSQFGGTGTNIHHNVFYNGTGYNMGGCMGCHGSQGQDQGGDFSVIVARGPVGPPEFPAPITNSGTTGVPRNRLLK